MFPTIFTKHVGSEQLVTFDLPLVAILLGTLRMKHVDVRKLVLSVDDEKLTEQLLQQLLKYLPNKEEVSVCLSVCLSVAQQRVLCGCVGSWCQKATIIVYLAFFVLLLSDR